MLDLNFVRDNLPLYEKRNCAIAGWIIPPRC